MDPDIAIAALKNVCGQVGYGGSSSDFAKWVDIPEELQNDLGFCAKAISAGVSQTRQVSIENKDIMAEEFLKNLTMIPDEDWFERLLEESPDLANERRFCLAVASSPALDVESFFEEDAPLAMRSAMRLWRKHVRWAPLSRFPDLLVHFLPIAFRKVIMMQTRFRRKFGRTIDMLSGLGSREEALSLKKNMKDT